MMPVGDLLRKQHVICCLGPGGVGKTTVAAALGILAACQGRRVLVMTVDPAKRLADALGLRRVDHDVIEVPLGQLCPQGAQRGALSATMLDAGSSFDAVIRRLASEPVARRIAANRLYRVFSRALARSHAQAAMERLYDVARDDLYDLVILDTPPMRAALEILDAPRRLLDFFDSGVVRWFVQPPRGRLSHLLPRGSSAVARLLSLLGSRRLVAEASHFFGVLAPLEPGLRQRAEGVEGLLRQPDTSFLLVCAPRATSLADAASLRDGLRERGVGLHAVVFNRAYVPEVGRPALPVSAVRTHTVELAEKERRYEPLLGVLADLRAQVAARNVLARKAAAAFCSDLSPTCSVAMIPELAEGIRDLSDLLELARLIEPREQRMCTEADGSGYTAR